MMIMEDVCRKWDRFGGIDLGLPSGLLWGRHNVGGSDSWDIGDFYAWGEVQTKNIYNWDTYKWCKCHYKGYGNFKVDEITKYIDRTKNLLFTKTKKNLDASDDVASVHTEGRARIPTENEWLELINKCHWRFTDNYNGTGIHGWIVYKRKSDATYNSLSDIHIFLPFPDELYGGRIDGYWSSSLFLIGGDSLAAYSIKRFHCPKNTSFVNRCYGLMVRAVRSR